MKATPPPLLGQQKNDTCALACLRMILAQHGIQVEEQLLEEQTSKYQDTGVHVEDLARLAERYGFGTEIVELELDTIGHLIARGIFPIVYLNRVYFEKAFPLDKKKTSFKAEV